MGQQWEHHVFWWNLSTRWGGKKGSPGIRAMLQARGEDGWELVAVTDSPENGYTFFFKRPVQDASSEHGDGFQVE
jgi:hypothetical protein